MAAIHKPRIKKQYNDTIEEEKPRCPKCKSRNVLTIGERGDRTISCLDCDYTEGAGTS